jgi:alpha-ketoglutarate-dependent taurine dioxygenase
MTAQAIRSDSTFDFGPEVSVRPFPDGGWPYYVDARAGRLRQEPAYARAWFCERKAAFDHALAHAGALILRGFAVSDADSFSRFIAHYPPMPQGYAAGSAKRVQLADRVYDTTSTRAADFKTRLHQEMAYLPVFPRQLAFFCHVPPATGGETIIGDMRRLQKLVPPALLQAVADKGVRYQRSFRVPGQQVDAPAENQHQLGAFYRTWQDTFATADRAQAETVMRSMQLEFEWLPNGGLTTSYKARGFLDHPLTGETVWFNQVTLQHANHIAAGMARDVYARAFPPGAPKAYDVVLGDGTPIAEDVIMELYHLQDDITVAPPWQAGDVMLLDNIYTAHGGNPYTGPRDIQVSLFH